MSGKTVKDWEVVVVVDIFEHKIVVVVEEWEFDLLICLHCSINWPSIINDKKKKRHKPLFQLIVMRYVENIVLNFV